MAVLGGLVRTAIHPTWAPVYLLIHFPRALESTGFHHMSLSLPAIRDALVVHLVFSFFPTDREATMGDSIGRLLDKFHLETRLMTTPVNRDNEVQAIRPVK